jgi:hypothetical protein
LTAVNDLLDDDVVDHSKTHQRTGSSGSDFFAPPMSMSDLESQFTNLRIPQNDRHAADNHIIGQLHQYQQIPTQQIQQQQPMHHVGVPMQQQQFKPITILQHPQHQQQIQPQQQQQQQTTPQKEETTEGGDETRPRSSSFNRTPMWQKLIYNTYNPSRADSTYNTIHRRLFTDTKLMSSEEIESIVRQQMQDLQIKNPYVDDYVYISNTNKKNIEAKRINANFANWVHEGLSIYYPKSGKTEEELKREEMLSQQPRVFGRIPSQNVRAPRELFEIDQELKEIQNSPFSMSTIRRDPNANLNCLIENGLLFLVQIQDFALCMRNIQDALSQNAIHEFFGLCQLVTRMLNLTSQQQLGFTFFQILEKRKGVKFVSKAIEHLPEPFSVHLLKTVLLSWGIIMSYIAKNEDAEELTSRFIKDTQTALSNLSLVAICQLIHDDPSRDAIININYQQFFAFGGTSVLATLLRRAFELTPNDPHVAAWRSDFAQLFKVLHSYKFSRIATLADGWKLLEQVLAHSDDNQKKALVEDLKQYLTQKPTPDMGSFLRLLQLGPQY